MLKGVGAIIINEGKILLLLRKRSPEKGKWGLPGGSVKVGEKIESALKREVNEELGVEILHQHLIDCFIYEVKAENFICESYIFISYIQGNAINVEKNIHEQIQWFDLNYMPNNITIPVKRALLQDKINE